MNTKVVWLTSVAVWFWLAPVVKSAEEGEAPELERLSEKPQSESLTSEILASQSARDLLPIAPTAAIQPDAIQPDAAEPQVANTPSSSPLLSPIADADIADAETLAAQLLPDIVTPDAAAINQLAAADDLADAPIADLITEPIIDPLPRVVAPKPNLPSQTDPLEDWSTDAWLDLLSEPEDSPTPYQPEPDDAESDHASHLSQPQPSVYLPATPNITAFSSDQRSPLTPLTARAEPSEVPLLNRDSGGSAMAQVTSVSQLADVQPTDWAYQALQSLVERYGVIGGYPDGTFRGERALTRYEFAAGVNAAMDRITEIIASSSKDAVTEADLAVLSRLQEDFGNELIVLRGRLDGLEARIAEVAANQFSTTVVLNGQTTFALADAWGGDPPGLGETNPFFAYLTQLQLSGAFSERDAFKLDFDAGNFTDGGFADPQALNTQMALMGFQTDTNNTLELSGAEYRFAVGDRLVLTFKPVGFGLNSVLSPNSIFSSSTQGALSRFAAETPIFRMGSLDAGLGLDLLMTDRTRLQIAYGARNASDPEQGLFKSDHRALGVQLLARPFRTVTTGFAYVNAFADDGFLDTFTGSTNADTSGGFLEPAAIHALSGTLQWQIVPSVILAAWGGAAVTDSLSSDAVALSSTYQFSLGFPDTFGREGDLLGVMVGQPFRLRYGLLIEREDEASGLHYEVFYRIRLNDNIAITPGVFVVTDPGHIAENNTIVVGAIRTAFSF